MGNRYDAAPSPSWREERRRDKEAAAQIGRDDQAAKTQASIAAAEATARMRREEQQVKRADRKAARRQRAIWRTEQMNRLREQAVNLLFIPVILVPAALAWSAMGAYGYRIFGPAGLALPAFSEGAMWTFEAAATWTANRHPGRPTWHLRLGAWVFAAIGAGLNFLHGMPSGISIGLVMAIVSAAGLLVHQIVHMGPRRTRAERDAARIAAIAARRERAIQKAAVKRAIAEVDDEGNARLVYRPGMVTMDHDWRGRVRLADVPATLPWPGPAPAVAAPSAPVEVPIKSVASEPPKRAIAAPPERRERRAIERPAPAPIAPAPTRQKAPQKARQKASTGAAAKRAKATALLRANLNMPRADVVAQSGASRRTVDRIRAELSSGAEVRQISDARHA
jgi:hypothetical protein